MTYSALPHVVIIGAGFGGLSAARALRHKAVRITLIDRWNHHLFQPLLYQVATAGLSATEIAKPIRKVVGGNPRATVLMAEVTHIDPTQKIVFLGEEQVHFDKLVIATGATHAYFGHDDWGPHAPGLKSIADAFEIRRRVLTAFESAERESDPAAQIPWLTFAVVGAGPTGVELAGALRELAHHTIVKDFRNFDPRKTRVILLEGTDRVLPTFTQSSSNSARKQLEHLGVEVRTQAMVSHIDGEGFQVGDERIAAKTVLWAAGVKASPLGKALGVPLDRVGRVAVQTDLTVPGQSDIFVIGDTASVTDVTGRLVPGVAPAAMQEGRLVARNIMAQLLNKPTTPFKYLDKGSMATIGRSAAVAEFKGLRFTGFIAWLAWLFVHLLFLVGFRNKLVVLIDWAWAYLGYRSNARIIVPEEVVPSPQ